MKPSSTTVANIGGVSVDVARYSDLPIWNERRHRYRSSRVVFAYVVDGAVLMEEHDMVARELWRYSVRNRPFLFTMDAFPCAVVPKGPGGCVGADLRLAYYDEDGDGKFESMEMVNSIISPDDSQNWRPRIPAWAVSISRQ